MNIKLKYDLKTRKFTLIAMIVFIAIFVFSAIGFIFLNRPIGEVSTGLAMFVVAGGYTSLPASALFIYLFVDANTYIKRLERNGFTVPHDKRECSGLLNNLPHEGEYVRSRYNKDSLYAAGISMFLFAGMVILDVSYYLKWHSIESDSIVLFILLLMFHLLFVLIAFIFWHQRDTDKYRDNVDLPEIPGGKVIKKARICLWSAVLGLIILSLISLFAVYQADSTTKYIHKSRDHAQMVEKYDI